MDKPEIKVVGNLDDEKIQEYLGKEADKLWKKYNKLRPDYKQYTKNLKIKEKIDEKLIPRNNSIYIDPDE